MSEMRNTPLLEAVCALVKQRGKLGYLTALEVLDALLRQHRPEIMGPDGEDGELVGAIKPASEEETSWE